MKLKYPRTFHLEWSEGKSSDDKTQFDLSNFVGKEVVITEKMDGENTTMMNDSFYARSLDSIHHPSRDFVKSIWGNIRHDIPDGFRICGENLYAKHSVEYHDLESYFLVFSTWENNVCHSWDDTLEYIQYFQLNPVREIYRGEFDLDYIKSIQLDTSKSEGYVVRLASSFYYEEFSKSVVKWVRKGHVQTDAHWMHSEIIPNKLA